MNFWLVLLLLPLAIAMSATGWLLPYDQHGFWASRVPIGIMGVTPVLGPWLQKIAMGGSTIGHHTLTHFLALHAGLLPLCLAVLLGAHYYLTRRHGFADAPKDCACPDERYFPAQFLKDAVACLVVLVVLLGFVLVPHWQNPAAAPGVHLGAPADPSEQYSAARPEWFMLFLFQFLKYFPGGTEVWGAIVIPTFIGAVVALMPFVAKWRHGHRFNVLFLISLLVAATVLGRQAVLQDRNDETYLTAKADATRAADRIRDLTVERGIPPSGAAALLRDDPYTQGPKLFAKNCASCHRYDGHDGTGQKPSRPTRCARGDLGKHRRVPLHEAGRPACDEPAQGRSTLEGRGQDHRPCPALGTRPEGLRQPRLAGRADGSGARLGPGLLWRHQVQGWQDGQMG